MHKCRISSCGCYYIFAVATAPVVIVLVLDLVILVTRYEKLDRYYQSSYYNHIFKFSKAFPCFKSTCQFVYVLYVHNTCMFIYYFIYLFIHVYVFSFFDVIGCLFVYSHAHSLYNIDVHMKKSGGEGKIRTGFWMMLS